MKRADRRHRRNTGIKTLLNKRNDNIMSKIGYIRVSTERQETARQQEIMCDYQVDRIFSEKLSGANADRPQLGAMLDCDTLYVESISRLGRSTKDLLNIIDTLHKQGRETCQQQGEYRHRYSVGKVYAHRVCCPLSA